MSRRVRSYESSRITVEYDVRRCVHAEACVHGLPAVFDPARRPWIDPSQAAPGDIAHVVERCPTGALRYARQDEGGPESPAETNEIRVDRDGPLFVRGDLRISLPDGQVLSETRAALCRCGQSENKPFCDNSHREARFRDAGVLVAHRLKEMDPQEGACLQISFAQNGPILLRGPLRVTGSDEGSCAGGGGALCRCGGSASKPFCDGTHKRVGFAAD